METTLHRALHLRRVLPDTRGLSILTYDISSLGEKGISTTLPWRQMKCQWTEPQAKGNGPWAVYSVFDIAKHTALAPILGVDASIFLLLIVEKSNARYAKSCANAFFTNKRDILLLSIISNKDV